MIKTKTKTQCLRLRGQENGFALHPGGFLLSEAVTEEAVFRPSGRTRRLTPLGSLQEPQASGGPRDALPASISPELPGASVPVDGQWVRVTLKGTCQAGGWVHVRRGVHIRVHVRLRGGCNQAGGCMSGCTSGWGVARQGACQAGQTKPAGQAGHTRLQLTQHEAHSLTPSGQLYSSPSG